MLEKEGAKGPKVEIDGGPRRVALRHCAYKVDTEFTHT